MPTLAELLSGTYIYLAMDVDLVAYTRAVAKQVRQATLDSFPMPEGGD